MWALMPNVLIAALSLCIVAARVVDFEADGGAVPEQDDSDAWWTNGRALNATLASLQPGDLFVIPNKTYYVMGGIRADNMRSVTIQLEGTLAYATDMKQWPRTAEKDKDGKGKVLQCWYGENWENVTFTASGTGTMDGRGATWWGFPGIGYLELGENRPRLINLHKGKGLLFEHILFKNSPYWTFWASDVNGLEVRHCSIDARRDPRADDHSLEELSAFNTDGFDVTGRNVWIHDVSIWNQDDCIAAKDDSQDMLFERIEASGLGLTIGSIGSSVVRNITFRNVHMHHTVKGIYMKFRGGNGTIQDVVFENIFMEAPSQYAIWIGPAQQSDSKDLCAAHPCSLCWPQLPGSHCSGVEEATYDNILLRNVTVANSKGSPGVILAGARNPMRHVVFEDVRFMNPGKAPFGEDFYHCKHVDGVARGRTWPVPPCFKDETGTCIENGQCTSEGRTCCSGRHHSTLHCHSGSRCGCIATGGCATHEADCCSGSGHRTLACNAALGFRCSKNTSSVLLTV